jgi:hypothetical protein
MNQSKQNKVYAVKENKEKRINEEIKKTDNSRRPNNGRSNAVRKAPPRTDRGPVY